MKSNRVLYVYPSGTEKRRAVFDRVWFRVRKSREQKNVKERDVQAKGTTTLIRKDRHMENKINNWEESRCSLLELYAEGQTH